MTRDELKKEIQILMSVEDRNEGDPVFVRMTTFGMRQFDRPDFEFVHVPALGSYAYYVELNELAYVVITQDLTTAPGDRFAVDCPAGELLYELRESVEAPGRLLTLVNVGISVAASCACCGGAITESDCTTESDCDENKPVVH